MSVNTDDARKPIAASVAQTNDILVAFFTELLKMSCVGEVEELLYRMENEVLNSVESGEVTPFVVTPAPMADMAAEILGRVQQMAILLQATHNANKGPEILAADGAPV